MFFQGRGKTYLAEVVDGVLQAPYKRSICPDSFSIELSTDSFEHINKCSAVDTPDYRGMKASSGRVTFSFANVADLNFALAVLGTQVDADTGTVADEAIPADIAIGDFWFLGGMERHRNVTSVVVNGDGSPLGPLLVADTDYTLDAETGMLTFLTAQTNGASVSYSYSDPASVSMLTAAQKEWAIMFEYINKANSNDKGSIELYRVRFDPATNMDFLSDELQIPQLAGTVLADQLKSTTDTDFGQFGRRIV
jgi:hypothetical protein